MADTTTVAQATKMAYDILKDFQPLLASIITLAAALTAASIAYRGAIAKVSFDRQVRNEDDIRRRYAVCLRLQTGAIRLARNFSTFADLPLGFDNFDVSIPRDGTWPEYEEAWQNLALIPVQSIVHLEQARFMLRFLRDGLEQQEAIGATPQVRQQIVETLQRNSAIVAGSSDALALSLGSELNRLQEMPPHYVTTSQRLSQSGARDPSPIRSPPRQRSDK